MAAKESRNDKKGLGRGWLAVREIEVNMIPEPAELLKFYT